MDVPANVEFILEGQITLGVWEKEGYLAVSSGYYLAFDNPVGKIKTIEVHPGQIRTWKNALAEGATSHTALSHKNLPIPAQWHEDNTAESGMGGRHHLYPYGTGIPLPCSHHRRVQQVCAFLAPVEYAERRFLC